MKKIYHLLLFLLFTTITIAQDKGAFVANLYGNYTFSDRVNFDYGHANIEEGFEYGIGLEFFPLKSSSIEIKYLRLDTSISVYKSNGDKIGYDDKVAINYILVGGNHYFDKGNKLTPYLGAGIGIAILETPNQDNETDFACEIKGGVKIKTASIVSLNLQASIKSIFINTDYGSNIGGYWVPNTGPNYGTSFQFGLGAIVGFNFKKKQ
ncbi:outer membrane beta-barrel protein [Flavobacterium sp. WC2509]|uniref:outer membrane beta-barrel protein n=1 Tax=Flavobacterium sp. WC2509 TaxID=3461406 RepID=UPI00404484A8